jgi:hypothetical protein
MCISKPIEYRLHLPHQVGSSKRVRRLWLLSAVSLFVVFITLGSPAYTMDFSQTHVNPFDGSLDPDPYLLMRGEIVPGDYDRLIMYATHNGVNLAAIQVILSSPGGDVTEALRLGKFLKSIFVPVSVGPKSGQCASACFIIFASAVDRTSLRGLIGIHRPYLSPERMRSLSPAQAEAFETKAMLDAEDYLHQLRVPNNLVEIMFEHASNEIHWLTDDELYRQLGKRPPWYEEFLIARCGLDKAVEQRFLEDPHNQVLYAQIVTVFACGHDVTRADAKKAFANAVSKSHQALWAMLREALPEWEKINHSAEFLAWLDQTDVFAGTTRRQLLKATFDKNDATRVVAIFKEYVDTHSRQSRPAAGPQESNPKLDKMSASN